MEEIFELLKSEKSRLVVANTSVGIYKDDDSTLLVDVQHVPELLENTVDDSNITIGSSNSITFLIDTLTAEKNKLDINSSKVCSIIFICEKLIINTEKKI